MRTYFAIFSILIIFLMGSCQPSPHFEKHIRFKNANWNKFTELNYEIPVEIGKSYTFAGKILTDSNYTRRKLGIGFYLYLPSGEKRLDDQEIRIRDFEYKALGEKDQKMYILPVIFRKNLSIDESGNLKLIITQNSQFVDNFGIIGLDLTVTEDK